MSDLAKIKFTHPTAIVSRVAAAAAARALGDEELKKLAVERAPDPAAFDEYPPIFIRVERRATDSTPTTPAWRSRP